MKVPPGGQNGDFKTHKYGDTKQCRLQNERQPFG